MVHLVFQPYGMQSPIGKTKYQYGNKELALSRLSKIAQTELFTCGKYWIEDESGKIILNSRQTKRLARQN